MATILAATPQSSQSGSPAAPAPVEEPAIYISSATLVLAQQQLEPVYAWQTVVRMPAAPQLDEEEVLCMAVNKTPKEAVMEADVEHAVKSQTAAAAATAAVSAATASSAALASRSNDLFTPAYTYDEEDDIHTTLRKFMSAERYHSEHNWLMSHTLVNLAGGDINSSRA